MMVGPVARKVAERRSDRAALVFGQAHREVERIGDAKAEQAAKKCRQIGQTVHYHGVSYLCEHSSFP